MMASFPQSMESQADRTTSKPAPQTTQTKTGRFGPFEREVLRLGLMVAPVTYRQLLQKMLLERLKPGQSEDVLSSDEAISNARFFFEKLTGGLMENKLLLSSVLGAGFGEVIFGPQLAVAMSQPLPMTSPPATTRAQGPKAPKQTRSPPLSSSSSLVPLSSPLSSPLSLPLSSAPLVSPLASSVAPSAPKGPTCAAQKRDGSICGKNALANSNPPRCGTHLRK